MYTLKICEIRELGEDLAAGVADRASQALAGIARRLLELRGRAGVALRCRRRVAKRAARAACAAMELSTTQTQLAHYCTAEYHPDWRRLPDPPLQHLMGKNCVAIVF